MSRMSSKCTEWEKIFVNCIPNKWLTSKIYKVHIQFRTKKYINDPIKK